MDRTVELGAFLDRVLAARRTIVGLVVVTTVVVGGIAFLLRPWYRAEASLLPPSEEISFGIGNLLKGIGIPGVKVPTQATPAEVFQAILLSRRVSDEMVRRFDLKTLYHKKLVVDAIKELRRHSWISVDDVGMVHLAVEDHDRQRAAAMANAYVELLDRVNREVRMTKGRRTRLFVETRLDETRRELAAAEQRLSAFEAQHKTVALSPEASSALEAAASNYANRSALLVRLGVLQSISREPTDEERQIRLQLEQIDRQLASLPATGMGLARLVRDVKVQEELYLLLTAQFEDARINEARDVPTVEQLDVATPPERKSRPKRLMMMATAFLLSSAAGIGYALIRGEARPGRAIRIAAGQ